jgi:hypothetical protein
MDRHQPLQNIESGGLLSISMDGKRGEDAPELTQQFVLFKTTALNNINI